MRVPSPTRANSSCDEFRFPRRSACSFPVTPDIAQGMSRIRPPIFHILTGGLGTDLRQTFSVSACALLTPGTARADKELIAEARPSSREQLPPPFLDRRSAGVGRPARSNSGDSAPGLAAVSRGYCPYNLATWRGARGTDDPSPAGLRTRV